MKKKLLLIILLSMCSITVYALSSKFVFDTSKLSLATNSKKDTVVDSFDKKYNLSYSMSSEDSEFEKEMKDLTKKATYLLMGGFNNINESPEEFYNRKSEWYDLRYAPEIPKVPVTDDNILGLDMDSQEYKDSAISGLAIPQLFNQANELGLIYYSYGDITVAKNDDIVITSIVLPNVKVKTQSEEDITKYEYVETNYILHYYFKKLKDEWKVYYLYGESSDNVDEYFSEIETSESKSLAIAPSYKSDLEKVYSFDKLEAMTQDELNNIYNSNVNNVVYLNAYYNNMDVASANGFFINDGLIVTTWNFLEKALIKAQYITVKGNNSLYEIDGIVTANVDANIAVIKLSKKNGTSVKLGNKKNVKVEDPAIVLSSKAGTGLITQTGIVITNDKYIQTSIPLTTNEEGSPLFNQSGEVIGINTTQSANSSISKAVNSDALKEIQDKFKSVKFDKIESIKFEELKENYYYTKLDKEKVINTIPKRKWKEYSKIGDIEKTINLELVKASYKDKIVSLRYKNSVSKYMNGIQISGAFRKKLDEQGYKRTLNDTNKSIYENKNYQIIIMDEFDYLIIVMVKL